MPAALPFARPSVNAVTTDQWTFSNGDEERLMPEYLEGWDYNTLLGLSRRVRVIPDQIRKEAGLPPSAQLGLIVSAFSSGSWLRSRCWSTSLGAAEQELETTFELDGGLLGGTLTLNTAVVLNADLGVERAFSAHLAGSVLWNDKVSVRLEGNAPLFPIAAVDFANTRFPLDAPWRLDVNDDDLNASLSSSLRLYINTRCHSVIQAFAEAAVPSPEGERILSAAEADVARLMVEHALAQDSVVGEESFEPGTLGFAFRNAVSLRFFGSAVTVRELRLTNPSGFSAELYSNLRLFGDE
jgi:hypothetical protein